MRNARAEGLLLRPGLLPCNAIQSRADTLLGNQGREDKERGILERGTCDGGDPEDTTHEVCLITCLFPMS